MSEPPTTNEVAVASLITKVTNCQAGQSAELAAALVHLLMAGARQPGFWSGEIIPPDAEDVAEWRLVQRFQTIQQACAWETSSLRAQLLGRLPGPMNGSPLEITSFASAVDESGVATAIVTDVKPGMEEAYYAWEEKIQIAQSKYPGYRGVYVQPPPPGLPGKWSTLLRFDSPESLNLWFASAERLNLLQEAEQFVEKTHYRKVSNSFPGWVPLDESTGQPPPSWKTAMLVLLGLFPIVILEMRFFNPILAGMNPTLRSFLSMMVSVCGTTFVTMPFLIKAFRWWLFPEPHRAANIHLRGTAIVSALFALEIAALWNLLPAVH
jgi:uncharacterized protein